METIRNRPAETAVKGRNRARHLPSRRQLAGLFFVLPAVTFTLLFFIIPLLMTIWMSLHDWPLIGTPSFIGSGNYDTLAADRQFWTSLGFTIRYTLLVTPPIFILAFVLALLVNLPLRGVGLFRTAYFIPVVIGLGASSLLWVWLLNDRVGPFNTILRQVNLLQGSLVWLGSFDTALFAIIVSVVWKTVGFTMVLLLTGMQAIPQEIYQAAMVDGASYLGRLRHITLPLLRPTIALALVLSVIGSFLAFDQFYIMTRGGPRNQTITVVYWIFNNSFTYFKMGYGAALSLVLMGFLVILSMLQLRLLHREISY
ncbi:MAG: sugar ABC transporter permease [Anaerolineae bacterium]|nr:sugar ABC transporter permease [Anaerolineae bacterium]